MASISCSLATELVDCSYPKVCIQTSNASVSSCQCISSFAYAGEDCDVPTASTHAYMTWLIILLLFAIATFFWAAYRLAPTLLNRSKWYTTNQLASVAMVALLASLVHMIYIIISLADLLLGGAADYPKDGLRSTQLWKSVFWALVLDVYLVITYIAFLSGAWIILARRSQTLKIVRDRDHRLVRGASIVFGILYLFVTVAIVLNSRGSQVYYFWGLAILICWMVWLGGTISISLTLRKMDIDNSFTRTLAEIRTTSGRAGISMLVCFIGFVLQGVGAVGSLAGHEKVPMRDAPTWIFGLAMVQFSLNAVIIFLTMYVIRRLERPLTSSKNGIDSKNSTKEGAATGNGTRANGKIADLSAPEGGSRLSKNETAVAVTQSTMTNDI